MPVDIVPFWDFLFQILSALAGVIVSAVLIKIGPVISKRSGIVIDDHYRDVIHSASMTGIRWALSKVENKLPMTIDVHNKVVADAISWVETKGAPEALQHFNLTTRDLEVLVTAKLHRVLGTA